MDSVRIGDWDVPVITANTVVVGTGSAGYCAAVRLVQFGVDDVVVIADKVGAGASRNAGSDKQTYYKLTLSGGDPDSVRDMAETLFSGQAMDGDNALAEAALSARAFLHLCELGVPFPQNRFGEFIGYKTDHDPRRRATSVGPYTSKSMVEALERQVTKNGTPVYGGHRVVDLITDGDQVLGLLTLNREEPLREGVSPFTLFRATNVVYATGGPAGMYADSVFPHGQWGASGAALRAGVQAKNLTEWQFGLASIHPRWNVSGTYMQAIPRFISTDADGGDEREFLTEFLPEYGDQLSRIFLKGYQWPFDVRKAHDGSSLIDLIVYQETVLRGRRVWLDFRTNPMGRDFDPAQLTDEARTYLERAGAIQATPIERLRHMNEPAYRFYLERNPGVDLTKDPLEVAVCAQHNNGGLEVDAWWHTSLTGLFAAGEAAGAHGVYRPGGAALNSGQVGATRAATFIAARRTGDPAPIEEFARAARPATQAAADLLSRATASGTDTTAALLEAAGRLMSDKAGPVRSAESVAQALAQVRQWVADYASLVKAEPTSRRSVDRVFLIRDILTSQLVYLAAMANYVEHGGKSRGAVAYHDPSGQLPDAAASLPESFRFALDAGALGSVAQVAKLVDEARGDVEFTWRDVRPIPDDDDFFENVWRAYREHRNVM